MERRRNVVVTALVCLGHFFSHFYYLLPLVLLPTLKEELGTSYTALGIALAGYGLATTLAQVPVGAMVDRVGAPLILVGGLVTSSLAMLSLGLMSGYAEFAAVILLLGIGDSVFHPADYSILARTIATPFAGRAYAAHNFAGQLGFAASPFVTALLAAHFGWRTAAMAVGSAGLLAAGVLFCGRAVLGGSAPRVDPPRGAALSMPTGWMLLMSRPILLSLTVFIGIGMVNAGVRDFSVTTLQLIYGASHAEVGSTVSLYLLASLIGILAGGWAADYTSRYRAIAAGSLAVVVVTLAAIAFVVPPFGVVAVGFALIGLFAGAVTASRDLLVRSITPPEQAGMIFAFVSLGISLASLGAPFLYGFLLDHAPPSAVFFVAGAIGAGTVALVIVGGRDRAAATATEGA